MPAFKWPDWLRRQPRNKVAVLIWAAFVLLMVAVGLGRLTHHRSFGSWTAFVASAGVAAFYSHWVAGRCTEEPARTARSDGQ